MAPAFSLPTETHIPHRRSTLRLTHPKIMAISSPKQDWLDKTLSQTQPWISECLSRHDECLSPTLRYLPTRLIHVGNGSQNPFLYVPPRMSFAPAERAEPWSVMVCPKSLHTKYRYLALSYCWGDRGNLVTTIENINERRRGIPWEEIPSTVQNAIEVTRKLGFRYLWIDALCIIQGPNGDWATESAKMGDVYNGAFLTISAAISPNVQHGFSQSLENKNRSNGLDTRNNPLYKRGWALQERILSRRVLIFSKSGLYWECQKMLDVDHGAKNGFREVKGIMLEKRSKCEIPPLPFQQVFSRLRDGLCDSEDWARILDEYRDRSLTLERDKLPALSGLAKLYHQYTNHDYLAGLWRQSLLTDLMWKTVICHSSSSDTGSVVPLEHTAPSWSWASAKGKITSSIHMPKINLTIAKVVDAGVELKDPLAPFGEVVSGSIVLCGPLLSENDVKMENCAVWKDTQINSCEERDMTWYLLVHIDSLGTGHGLSLKNSIWNGKTCFERLGYFSTKHKSSISWDNRDWIPLSDEAFDLDIYGDGLGAEPQPLEVSEGEIVKRFQDCTYSEITII
ncbi:HET domain containing protein [Hyaloscypha variabilis]